MESAFSFQTNFAQGYSIISSIQTTAAVKRGCLLEGIAKLSQI
jgi:hypothetical protein